MRTSTTLQVISAILILLFVYTAVSKLLDLHEFRDQMYNQTLPRALATVLIWSLPTVELITALLLSYPRTRRAGFYCSALLMTLFTGYIVLVLLNYFGRVPCSCGGVIRALGWKMHLVFNLFFLLLTIPGITISNRERRTGGKVN